MPWDDGLLVTHPYCCWACGMKKEVSLKVHVIQLSQATSSYRGILMSDRFDKFNTSKGGAVEK
jgi:hypothetical protein